MGYLLDRNLEGAGLDDPYSSSSTTGINSPDYSGSTEGGGGTGSYLKGAGAGLMGAGAFLSGFAQSNALKFQAEYALQNAGISLESGMYDAVRSKLLANQRIGATKAAYSASGVDINSGSAAEVLRASSANAELDYQNILHGADIKALNFRNQAAIDEVGANNAMVGGLLGGVSGLLTGGAALATM